MELVTAIIKPHMLDPVKDALKGVGIQGITVSEVKGFGHQGGHTETHRGTKYNTNFVPQVKLEVLIDAPDAEKVVDAIAAAARTGKIGDGKIWVTEVGRAVRIRTGEESAEAV
ncbi:MAG: P-II family nitrogen regulator [Acidimicrobiales bacterium]